jgi:digeranylgeranylglycerophospholipid reductase
MMEADVCVVGAGPGGSLAARYAAKECSVVVLEKRNEIGVPKQCAEGISQAIFDKISRPPERRWIARTIAGVRLIAPDGTRTESKSDMGKYGFILDRKVFDKGLAEDAVRAGAQILLRTMFLGARREDGVVRIKAQRFGEEVEVRAKIVIAADGMMSTVPRYLGIDSFLPLKFLESCAQYEMTGLELDDIVELYFGNEIAPGGYVWVFPKGDDTANVGLGIVPTKTKTSAKEFLDRFVERKFGEKKVTEFNAGGVDISGPLKKTYADNLMVVGDAARLTNALTGGGMHTAMMSGMFAGRVACEAIGEKRYDEAFLKRYQEMWEHEFGRELFSAAKAASVLVTLTDDDVNKISRALAGRDITELNGIELAKIAVKVCPHLLLRLKDLI